MSDALHPALLLIVGAPCAAWLPLRLRRAVFLLLPLLSYLLFWNSSLCEAFFAQGSATWPAQELMGVSLAPVLLDKLSFLFVTLFHAAAFLGTLYGLHVRRVLQPTTALVYAGSAVGAVLAGDWVTLFVFWEILAVSSVFQIWARRHPRASRAGFRYLAMHILSGVILLSGVLCLANAGGELHVARLTLVMPRNPATLAPWLILASVGIKTAFPLVHTWMVDAYPEATPAGTVFLSSFTTKVGVYLLARAFAGADLLIWVGAVMAMFPIYYAVVENDLRRVLAYSMINQLGFMVVGVGLGEGMGVNGAVAHAFVDVFFKGLLFMCMGAVVYRVGHCDASHLGHLRKSMPFTTVCCVIGALSICGVPLFSAFITKSMVMSEAASQGYGVIWLVLVFASACVLHHAGIKIPFFAFFGHDHGVRCEKPPLNMRVAMGLSAIVCVVLGVYPPLLYDLLPSPVAYEPYDLSHVSTQLQLLAWSTLALTFMMVKKIDPPELRSTNLDADWLWRVPAKGMAISVARVSLRLQAWMHAAVGGKLQRAHRSLAALHGPKGRLGSSWATGSATLWATMLLCVVLALSLVRG